MQRLAFAVFLLLFMFPAQCRDLGQWEQSDPERRAWFQKLKVPYSEFSCCGDADAYWTDEVRVVDGKVIATVTDDRDDEPLHRPHVPIGTQYVIPPDKVIGVDGTRMGNPTGHTITFLSGPGWINGNPADAANRPVLCFVPDAHG